MEEQNEALFDFNDDLPRCKFCGTAYLPPRDGMTADEQIHHVTVLIIPDTLALKTGAGRVCALLVLKSI